jgi:hypothetical protein
MGVARRRAFSIWLRTGRLPQWARPGSPEVKYNPWHDPVDGRFTFAGTGRYFGRGSSSDARAEVISARMVERPKEPKREAYGGFGGGTSGGGGAGGSWETTEDLAHRRRAELRAARKTNELSGGATAPKVERLATRRGWRNIEANGHVWTVDEAGATREINGTIDLSVTARRSRRAQRQAGGSDRRTSDDGGHYVARRFGGSPTTFNHFAQDSNFNRGRWRMLEEEWARDSRAGKRIEYRMVPVFEDSSRRPSYINVWWWVDGMEKSLRFPNEPQESPRARR